MPADAAASSPSVSELQQQIEVLEAELRARTVDCDEAQAREAALAEVLTIISRSGGDPQPVFEVILARAMTLCDAAFGIFNSFDGQSFKTVAARGVPEAYLQFRLSNPPDYGPETGPGRLVAGENSFHVVDMSNTDAYRAGDPNRRAIVDLGGARTNLVVALRKDNNLLGMMAIYRKEVRPFFHKQIALVQTFADQAVIAMENARLFGELRQRTDDLTESLEYQTATSEVLEVISRSTSDLQPVLDKLLASAAKLCGTKSGTVAIRQGAVFRRVATLGFTPETFRLVHSIDVRLLGPRRHRRILLQEVAHPFLRLRSKRRQLRRLANGLKVVSSGRPLRSLQELQKAQAHKVRASATALPASPGRVPSP